MLATRNCNGPPRPPGNVYIWIGRIMKIIMTWSIGPCSGHRWRTSRGIEWEVKYTKTNYPSSCNHWCIDLLLTCELYRSPMALLQVPGCTYSTPEASNSLARMSSSHLRLCRVESKLSAYLGTWRVSLGASRLRITQHTAAIWIFCLLLLYNSQELVYIIL